MSDGLVPLHKKWSRAIYVICAAIVLMSGGFALIVVEPEQDTTSSHHEQMSVPDTSFTTYSQKIGESLVTFDMVPVEGGTVRIETPDGVQEVEVEPFWISTTEVTWDAYDIFAYQLDLPEAERISNAEATTRPSRPYESPDYGFGHQGYAAMSVTYKAAEQFTRWLSKKTGVEYRLATEAEWVHAALAGMEGDGSLSPEELDRVAWYDGNAEDKTQPVASKEPNALGLYDMLGNVQEWVVGYDGEPVTRGGSYRSDVSEAQYTSRAEQTRRWNERDPQIPKSKWWLSDGPMVGFRLVRSLD